MAATSANKDSTTLADFLQVLRLRKALIALIVAGYLLAWLAFGVAAHMLDAALYEAALRSDWLLFHAWIVGSGILVVAGLSFAGGESNGSRVLLGVILPYAAMAAFLTGLVYRVLKWANSSVSFHFPTTSGQQK